MISTGERGTGLFSDESNYYRVETEMRQLAGIRLVLTCRRNDWPMRELQRRDLRHKAYDQRVNEHADVPPEVVAQLRSVCLSLPEAYEEQALVDG